MKVLCIAEYDGYVYDENGITDMDGLKEHQEKTGSILGWPGAKSFKYGDSGTVDPLTLECDILIPAAKELVITQSNMKDIKAKIIGEAANGPMSFEADEYLHKKGKIILPDLFLNSGGVCVSYFEWLKNINHVRFGRMTRRIEGERGEALVKLFEENNIKVTEQAKETISHGSSEVDHVHSALADSMINSLDKIIELKQLYNVDFRSAAMCHAVSKVAKVGNISGNIFVSPE